MPLGNPAKKEAANRGGVAQCRKWDLLRPAPSASRIRSQAAHPERGPTDRGQYRQAAGTPAPWVMRGCCRSALSE